MVDYRIQKPSVEEYLFLRNEMDWSCEKKGIDSERARASLDAAPICVCAYEGDKIIGMVRLSGDLAMYGYIQDTIVLPEYQGRGIGKTMMKMVIEKVEGLPCYLLGVCPSKVSVDFYQSFGFKKRPENPNGFMSIEF